MERRLPTHEQTWRAGISGLVRLNEITLARSFVVRSTPDELRSKREKSLNKDEEEND